MSVSEHRQSQAVSRSRRVLAEADGCRQDLHVARKLLEAYVTDRVGPYAGTPRPAMVALSHVPELIDEYHLGEAFRRLWDLADNYPANELGTFWKAMAMAASRLGFVH